MVMMSTNGIMMMMNAEMMMIKAVMNAVMMVLVVVMMVDAEVMMIFMSWLEPDPDTSHLGTFCNSHTFNIIFYF